LEADFMADDAHLLTDIRLGLRRSELRPVYTVDTDRRRVAGKKELLADMGLVSGRENLGQAIIVRSLTPRGELSALAHPDYGSRLHELIGRQNTETTRNLVKLYILESLKMEPRIEKVIELKVEPAKGTRDRVNVSLTVKPVGKTQTITVGPFTLELAK
jgi:phage baseplate assembly protein W